MENVIAIFENKGYSLSWDKSERNWRFRFNNEEALLNIDNHCDKIIVNLTLKHIDYFREQYSYDPITYIKDVAKNHAAYLVYVKPENSRDYAYINVISSFECKNPSKLEKSVSLLIDDIESLCDDYFKNIPWRPFR